MSLDMKVIRAIAVFSLFLGNLVNAEPPSQAEEVIEKVDALMKEQRAGEAADLLEKALKDNPDDSEILRKLGGIYSVVLKQPGKGAPLLEKAFKLSNMTDSKCLQFLALSQISMKDDKGILAYKKHYIDNFEQLSGARVVCFYIAGLERDGTLFNELLKKTPDEDIESDKSLTLMIARTAKVLVASGQ